MIIISRDGKKTGKVLLSTEKISVPSYRAENMIFEVESAMELCSVTMAPNCDL